MSFGIPVRTGLGVGLLASTSLATRNAFSPAALFAASEPGAWYDPSDLTTMFQDTAGTTPVTATGQTVARINDKSGRGNHATQATAASRPIYGIEPFGGRRNLLTYSSDWTNAIWVKSNVTVTAAATTSPDGTANAQKLEATTTAATQINSTTITVAATSATYSIYVKQGTGGTTANSFLLRNNTTSTNLVGGTLNYSTGVWTYTTGSAGVTVSNAGNGWWRLQISASTGITSGNTLICYTGFVSTSSTAGDFLYAYGAQLETGSTATAYQRVTDQWNVTQAGVPSVSYLAFDGTDDFLVTPTITPGTNAAQAFAGVRKLSDAATSVLFESSGVSTTNPGTIGIFAPSGAAANYNWRSQGSNTGISVSGVTFTAPITNVVTGIGDIVSDVCILRVNGAQVGSTAADQGTGNYLAYPIYIGRRNGTSFPLNGRIYSLIVRFGANLTAGQISQTESWVNGKTGAY